MKDQITRWSAVTVILLVLGLLIGLTMPDSTVAAQCERKVFADVVALDQPYFLNRLGAVNANGMMYALKRDVVNKSTLVPCTLPGANCSAGNVALRPDKRPRPIILRMNVGDCLEISFTNWLKQPDFIFNLNTDFNEGGFRHAVPDLPVLPQNPAPAAVAFAPKNIQFDDQPITREASIHVNGMQLVNNISDDGSFVGRNRSSLTAIGQTRIYTLYGEYENVYHLYSVGSTVGAEGGGGTMGFGLFGAVVVEPRGAEWYRSQVTHEEMLLASDANGAAPFVMERWPEIDGGQPKVNYDAVYPAITPFNQEGKAGLPVLKMMRPKAGYAGEIVHTDLHAIITGPNRGPFAPGNHYRSTPVNPQQHLPFREFASIWNDEQVAVQPFAQFYKDPVLVHTFKIVRDAFVINYASGGIGSEIIANRLGLGPMWDCPECKAEEFFLTSWAIGDPAGVTDTPAVFAPFLTGVPVGAGPIAELSLFPDDPANVHHSYLNDHVKFRNVHAGPFEHHIFHLHAHQWVFNPQSDKANYQDMQQVSPGSGYTMDTVNGGGGNRHKTPGDAIYHCHFYPHFAMGMWALWRVHDVFEEGTVVQGARLVPCNPAIANPADPAFCQTNMARLKRFNIVFQDEINRDPWTLRFSKPLIGSRAYPDGEVKPNAVNGACVTGTGARFDGLCTGTPIPAVVPMPLYAMAPMPILATVDPDDPRKVLTVVPGQPIAGNVQNNPGFPFWVAGYAGHRPPTPPLDILHDGGLPRHVITGGERAFVVTRLDLTAELESVEAEQFPEGGTADEIAAMDFHAVRSRNTLTPEGTTAPFITNGRPPVRGAPFADPCVDNAGNAVRAGSTPLWNNQNGEPVFQVKDGRGNPVPVTFGDQNPRVYKVANIMIDLVFNKVGWHYPQQRIITLWDDIADTYAGRRPAEPMVFRMNTLDCAEIWHTNLAHHQNELDDYQIRFPTDIIGQHVHMPKFDVSSADGAANGWNYEDGTFSPGEVLERIRAINAGGGLLDLNNQHAQLTPQAHPELEGRVPMSTLGARTTIQRWMADPVLDLQGNDRGFNNSFTHDHFGPSTFQQIGLYATVLAEPAGSVWRHNETGVTLGNRQDGGPTSWQAVILPPDPRDSFREFYFEFSDFQHAYERDWDGRVDSDSFLQAINVSHRVDAVPMHPIITIPGICPAPPGVIIPRPCPEAITASDEGTFVVNYRNEPVGLRVFDRNRISPFDGRRGAQALGQAGDLAYAFASIPRVNPELNAPIRSYVRQFNPVIHDPTTLNPPGSGITNLGGILPNHAGLGDLAFNFADPRGFVQNVGNELLTGAGRYAQFFSPEIIDAQRARLSQGVGNFDPATPMMRTYEGDQVRVRAQVGAHEESHVFSIHGVKWLMNYADPASGFRNAQSMGISEQFQFNTPVMIQLPGQLETVDYYYASDTTNAGNWTGTWGLMRAYNVRQNNLVQLPNNQVGPDPVVINNQRAFRGICPVGAPRKTFDITAVPARTALRNNPAHQVRLTDGTTITSLVYNSRPTRIPDIVGEGGERLLGGQGPLHDPAALMYVPTADLLADGTLRSGAPVEPLVLRANAGDCIEVTLRNRMPAQNFDLDGWTMYPGVINRFAQRNPQGILELFTFNANDVIPSSHAGLHTQLLAYDVNAGDGTNVGNNRIQTAAPGGVVNYQWYAGHIGVRPLGLNNLGQRLVDLVPVPIEFGAVGLLPADKLKQVNKGLVGALVILPQGTQCENDSNTRAQAECENGNGEFRDFVAVTQRGVNLHYANVDAGVPASQRIRAVQNFKAEGGGAAADDEDSGHSAINYRTEPEWFRLAAFPPHLPLEAQAGIVNTARVYSNSQVGGEAQTPIMTAEAGDPVRFHFVEPGGGSRRAHTPKVHGHLWQRTPYIGQEFDFDGDGKTDFLASVRIGDNPFSQKVGSQDGFGGANFFDFILEHGAGGAFGIPGDYYYGAQDPSARFTGMWGVFRVLP